MAHRGRRRFINRFNWIVYGATRVRTSIAPLLGFILPLVMVTRWDNARMDSWPAERWVQTRQLTEMFSRLWVHEIISELINNLEFTRN